MLPVLLLKCSSHFVHHRGAAAGHFPVRTRHWEHGDIWATRHGSFRGYTHRRAGNTELFTFCYILTAGELFTNRQSKDQFPCVCYFYCVGYFSKYTEMESDMESNFITTEGDSQWSQNLSFQKSGVTSKAEAASIEVDFPKFCS